MEPSDSLTNEKKAMIRLFKSNTKEIAGGGDEKFVHDEQLRVWPSSTDLV
jgi:hypothetical protein